MVNVVSGFWAIRKIMYAQDRENVGIECRKEIVGPNHQCYIQSYECKSEMTENEGEEEVSQPKKSRFIFFDFESNQETGTHQVNFCVALKACDDCMDLPIGTICLTCSTQTGLREFIFEGIDTLPQFCNWILGDENKGVTCIAHNFGAYDMISYTIS